MSNLNNIVMYLDGDKIRYQLSNLKQLTFEVTDDCNLKCKYCAYGEFYNDYDERRKTKMSISVAKKTIDYLKELWNSQYNMYEDSNVYISFYGGEPLLNMPFIESIVEYINTSKIPHRHFTFTITTNGILLGRYIDFLVKNKFNVTISLDGNEYNTSYRVDKAGRNSYLNIVKNIAIIREKHPLFFEQNVNFNAVLHNRNSVQEIYNFFKEKYNKTPSIGELNNMGIRPDKKEAFKQTYRNSLESLNTAENYETIAKDMFMQTPTYKTLTTFVHKYSGFVFHDYTDLLFGSPVKTIPTGTCIPFSRKMFITVNGKIMPCERIGQQFALGSITESGIDLDFDAIASKYNVYFSKLERQCFKCYNKDTCIQCVFNLNDIENTPQCLGFTTHQQFLNHKKSLLNFIRNNPEAYYRIMEDVIIE